MDRYDGTKAYYTYLTLVCYNLSQNHNLHTMHKTNASSSLSPLLLFWCRFPQKVWHYSCIVYTSSFSFFFLGYFLLYSKMLYMEMIVYRALHFLILNCCIRMSSSICLVFAKQENISSFGTSKETRHIMHNLTYQMHYNIVVQLSETGLQVIWRSFNVRWLTTVG